jgi:hypothetical protein
MSEIFYNGIFYTGEESAADSVSSNNDSIEAMAIEDGIIVKTGTKAELENWADETAEWHDLKGRFIVPGFNDSHMHILNYGRTLRLANLAEATDSLQHVIEELQNYKNTNSLSPEAWVVGWGWNHDYFQDEKRFPDRNDLDKVSKNQPVVAIRACGHIASANSAALKIAGVLKGVAQPEGGCFDVNEDGEPTGVFREYGVDLISSFIPPPDKNEIKACLLTAMKKLNSYGITSAQSDDLAAFSGVPYEMVLEAYQELEAEGKITVKVYEQCLLSNMDTLKNFVENGYHTGIGSDFFRIGPLKILSDGSLGARTAYLSQPYEDDKIHPDNRGIAIYNEKELHQLISFGHCHGMQVAVHAIGDAAIEMAVSGIRKAQEEYPERKLRHGIVHCQITTPKLLDDFKELGLHAYIQSVFLDYDNHIVESRIGAERALHTYQFKTLLDMGLSVSNGSDCPVEIPDVLRGIQCAVTRTCLDGSKTFLEDQALTVEEALKTYTIMGARVSSEEEKKGLLVQGMAADFTVLDRDIRCCPANEIKDAAVCETYVNGKVVFVQP